MAAAAEDVDIEECVKQLRELASETLARMGSETTDEDLKRVRRVRDYSCRPGVTHCTPQFLIARDMRVDSAARMMARYADWREATPRVTDEEVDVSIRSGKSFFHKHDKAGRPCLYVRAQYHIPLDQRQVACVAVVRHLPRLTAYMVGAVGAVCDLHAGQGMPCGHSA